MNLSALATVMSISVGASLGALLRWVLSTWLNSWWPAVPLGTLAANLIGCFLVGVAINVLAMMPGWSPLWRLFIITGFMGGLTTFSTFSAEVVSHLAEGRLGAAMLEISIHVIGGLLMTLAGMGTVWWLQR